MPQTSRRNLLKGGLMAAGLGFLDVPDWAVSALAQGESIAPFLDIPETFNPNPSAAIRVLDIRKIDGPFTPADQFFTTQHYGHPEIDAAAYRLKISGLVHQPKTFSLADLRAMRGVELIAGFECSGNSKARVQGFASNGRWSGVPLRAVLEQAGVRADARELVFFGADHGEENVEFRQQTFTVDQQFGRSLSREQALSAEPLLAYALNGEPLTKHQGFPLRLIMPGWYGVANVKWLSQVHVQAEEYLGKFQARWYRTLRGETIDGETKWTERAVTRMQLKSVVARVSRTGSGSQHTVLGYALNDGTPLKAVEVRVDEGPWQPATLDPATSGAYSWKLFRYTWDDAMPGEHTIVSRAIDANGVIQPTAAQLEHKKTFLEDNSQFVRRVMVG
jgi:DMSO/TMAO reductase YedYZ molybdopterin-dependent catalytic subunit